jgi:hypothetical protein
MREFICQVDAGNRIVFVDASWVSFAAENGLPSLTLAAVKGRLLWDFITDETSQHVYKALARQVRRTGRMAEVPFRCDSPECRRFMKMFILSLAAGALEFHSVLLREEPRPRVDLLDPEFPRTEEFLTMCAWCKKVHTGEWLEAEEAVRRLRLFEQPRLPRITHGVCPACQEAFELELKPE